MNSPLATVIARSEDRVRLRAESFGCARCKAGVGCGAGLLSFGSSDAGVDIELEIGDTHRGWLRAGQRVAFELPDRQLLRVVAIVYGLPLLGVLLGAGLGSLLWSSDRELPSILFALLGLFAGFLLGQHRARCIACDLSLRPANAPIDPRLER